MRTRSGRLPVLTVVLLQLAAVAPAGAADEGDVGIVDDVVEVAVSSQIDGYDDADVALDADCLWQVSVEDDLVSGVYGKSGERLVSETGRWFELVCEGEVTPVNGEFVSPEGGGISLPDLLQEAVDRLDPPSPAWRSSPDGIEVPMVVRLPTWLWVEDSYWQADFIARAEIGGGRVWATASAQPSATTWLTGDGSVVNCSGPGVEWSPGRVESSCTHTYRHSTADRTRLSASVTVTFEVLGMTSLDAAPALIGAVIRTSEAQNISVGEIQALETSGV